MEWFGLAKYRGVQPAPAPCSPLPGRRGGPEGKRRPPSPDVTQLGGVVPAGLVPTAGGRPSLSAAAAGPEAGRTPGGRPLQAQFIARAGTESCRLG